MAGASKRRKTKLQIVYSERRKLFQGKVLSPKGKRLLAAKEITKKEAYSKYGKNKYSFNPKAKPIKVITHNRWSKL